MTTGSLGPFLAAYPGNPTGVSITIFDVPPGTIVVDTTSGGAYRKTSVLGDNSGYSLVSVTKAWSEDFLAADTADSYTTMTPLLAAVSYTAQATNHIRTPKGNILLGFPIGASQTVSVAAAANGMNIKGADTTAKGWEIAAGAGGAVGSHFTVGSDPAFYMQAKIAAATVANVTSFLCGFRNVGQAAQAAYDSYTEYGAIGIEGATIKTFKTGVALTTGQSLTDATALTVKMLVSAAGVVTWQHDLVTPGTLAAPSAVTTLTLTDGLQVIPFIFFISGGTAGETTIRSLDIGFQ